MKLLRAFFFAAVSSLMLPGGATAAILFTSGTPLQDSGTCASTGGSCTTSYALDDFTLGSNSTVTSISWTATLSGGAGASNGMRAWILSGPSILTGGGSNILHAINLQTGAPVVNPAVSNAYDLTLSGLSINLAAGTYWLAVQADIGSGFATAVLANNTGNGLNETNSFGLSGLGGDMVFTIEGTSASSPVPLPSTLGLLLLSGLAIPLVRRFAH